MKCEVVCLVSLESHISGNCLLCYFPSFLPSTFLSQLLDPCTSAHESVYCQQIVSLLEHPRSQSRHVPVQRLPTK